MNSVISLAVLGFALYIIWTVARPRWDFEIVVKPDSVDFVKGVANAQRRAVESFFMRDLKPAKTFSIYGRREQTGRLTTLIKGLDDEGIKQRIRNFLMTIN